MHVEEKFKELESELNRQGYYSVCFWLPTKPVGGGPAVMCEMISALIEHTELKIYFVDYADGYAHVLLGNEPRVQFINYDEKASQLPIPEPVVVFTNSTRVIQLKNMNMNSKVVFWHWETVPCAWQIVLLLGETKRLMRLIRKHNAMLFHDCAAWDVVSRQVSVPFDKNLLPVYTPCKSKVLAGGLLHPDEITIGWVGRFAVDKANSIYNIIDNFVQYKTEKHKRLILVGDGIKRSEVESYVKESYPEQDIQFIGTIPNEWLAEYLIHNVDVLFAMGTSILDGAASKLPAAVVSLSDKRYTDDFFVWLYDSVDYCLGPLQAQKNRLGLKYTKFSEMLDSVLAEHGKEGIGQKCYDYYIKYHSSRDDVALMMLKFFCKATLTMSEIKDCIQYMPYNKISSTQFVCKGIPIWSVTTFENEKTYRLFGLTLLKLRWVGNDKMYIPFGIRPVLHRFTYKGYGFPGVAKKFTPAAVSSIHLKKIMDNNQEAHRKNLVEKVKRGEKITVCLFAPRITDFLFSNIYRILDESKEFEPVIVVSPFPFQGKEEMISLMEQTYSTLKAEGYRVIKTYDEETDTYFDLRKAVNPDVLFYTMYWKPHFHEDYYINNFMDKLNFLTPYCVEIIRQKGLLNFELRNAVNRCFLPTPIHKKMSEEEMDNQGENVYITGIPKLDPFFDTSYQPKDVWKPQNKPKKRIIWAPHHSDGFSKDLYQFNAFYELYEFMLELAQKYRDEIQIAFKPHPMLKVKLDKKWGEEVANAYYQRWATLENTQLETGEFIDLFLTSDAMIFDSISFITEYTATRKPSFFTIGTTSRVYLNEYGEENFKVLYKNTGELKSELKAFIEDVVIKGIDPMKEKREQFVNTYILPPNGKSASQNIVDNMYEEIFRDERE